MLSLFLTPKIQYRPWILWFFQFSFFFHFTSTYMVELLNEDLNTKWYTWKVCLSFLFHFASTYMVEFLNEDLSNKWCTWVKFVLYRCGLHGFNIYLLQHWDAKIQHAIKSLKAGFITLRKGYIIYAKLSETCYYIVHHACFSIWVIPWVVILTPTPAKKTHF